MASLGLMFCPATRSPRQRQLSNSRLQFNTQCPERFAKKIPADMVLIKRIHTAVSDTVTPHIIPASSVECESMRRQGLNYQFRIKGHLATNMSKATWPSHTPITIQSQQHELHSTGKDSFSGLPTETAVLTNCRKYAQQCPGMCTKLAGNRDHQCLYTHVKLPGHYRGCRCSTRCYGVYWRSRAHPNQCL